MSTTLVVNIKIENKTSSISNENDSMSWNASSWWQNLTWLLLDYALLLNDWSSKVQFKVTKTSQGCLPVVQTKNETKCIRLIIETKYIVNSFYRIWASSISMPCCTTYVC